MTAELLSLARAALGPDGDSVHAAQLCLDRAQDFLLPARDVNARLQARALDRWTTPFATLELELLLAAEIAAEHHGTEPTSFDPVNPGDEAFHDLFWSGHTVAREVVTLLTAGLSTGAYARWRALHEVATRAELIAGAGDQLAATARRYLDHEALHLRAELRLTRTWLRALGNFETLTKEHTRLWAELDREAVDGYGHIFRGDYGWAHELLKATNERYRSLCETTQRLRGPIFNDLERHVRLEHDDPKWYELLYAEANAAVHGSPRAAATFSDDGQMVMRRTPEPAAIEIPVIGAATARRLADLTWACVVHDDGSPEDVEEVEAWMQMLEVLSVVAGRAEWEFGDAATRELDSP